MSLLAEDDIEAAFATLLGSSSRASGENAPASTDSTPGKLVDNPITDPPMKQETPRTPLRDAARLTQTMVSDAQIKQLRELLQRHYQLLVQQAVQAIRAAHAHKITRLRDQS